MNEIRTGKNDQGQRLDKFISDAVEQLSRTKAQELILQGKVTVNRQTVTSAKYQISDGDIIHYEKQTETPVFLLRSVKKPIEIHYEDDEVLVVFKPAGLVTHPSAKHEDDSLVQRLFGKTALANDPENPIRPGIVHRLDMDTSGLLVIAKTDAAKQNLGNQFMAHTITRKYVALVWGKAKKQKGTIRKKLAVHPQNRLKVTVSEKGKDAVTHWRCVKTLSYGSVMICELETGRTHQIRVHLLSEGLSVIGDKLYGNRTKIQTAPDDVQSFITDYEGHFLHAFQLGFIHPKLGIPLNFYRQPPLPFHHLARTHEPPFDYRSLLF